MSEKSRTVKVAHLTSVHPRDDVRIFWKECRSLVRAEFGVTLVVADGLGDAVCEGVNVVDAGRSSGRLGRMFGATRRVYKKALALNAHIYHLHDPELLPVGLALKRRGKMVVFDSHEDISAQIRNKPYLNRSIACIVSTAYAWFERFACRTIDAVVAATPFIRQRFADRLCHATDVCNYPVLGELDSVNPDPCSTQVCYVGGISRTRGLVEMVRAIGLADPSVSLHLVGQFDDARLRDDVRRESGWGKVVEHGQKGRAGVSNVMQKSFAGLVTLHPLPNYQDALPIKMFEYMSAGLPVIASDFPAWRQIIDEAACGLCVDPMAPESIAEAIDYLRTNPEMARAMGERGRQAVRNRYHWDIEEKKLLAVYSALSGKLLEAG